MVHSICYALMEKSTRMSTMTYKEDGIGLLRALYIKYASVDSQTRLREKKAFIECRISHNLISSTKTQVVTSEQALKSKLRDNNLNTSAESSIIYSNFLDTDSLTTTVANLEIKKIAKDLEYKPQQQMKIFEVKHNTPQKKYTNRTKAQMKTMTPYPKKQSGLINYFQMTHQITTHLFQVTTIIQMKCTITLQI